MTADVISLEEDGVVIKCSEVCKMNLGSQLLPSNVFRSLRLNFWNLPPWQHAWSVTWPNLQTCTCFTKIWQLPCACATHTVLMYTHARGSKDHELQILGKI